jgi:hypothetical protein
LITAGIFAAAWYASDYFNDRKIADLQQAQQQATVDFMSSEAQFDLYEDQTCDDVSNTSLAQELSSLADKISYAEQNLSSSSQLTLLKQQYSVLEVKDFLLTKEINERCNSNVATILYFYENANNCSNCTKQGYVLDAIRQNYPNNVRVYSFDVGLDSSTIRALLTIYKVSDTALPAVVVNGTTYTGFQSIEQMTAELPTSVTNPPATTATAAKVTSSTTKK